MFHSRIQSTHKSKSALISCSNVVGRWHWIGERNWLPLSSTSTTNLCFLSRALFSNCSRHVLLATLRLAFICELWSGSLRLTTHSSPILSDFLSLPCDLAGWRRDYIAHSFLIVFSSFFPISSSNLAATPSSCNGSSSLWGCFPRTLA